MYKKEIEPSNSIIYLFFAKHNYLIPHFLFNYYFIHGNRVTRYYLLMIIIFLGCFLSVIYIKDFSSNTDIKSQLHLILKKHKKNNFLFEDKTINFQL